MLTTMERLEQVNVRLLSNTTTGANSVYFDRVPPSGFEAKVTA